MKNPKRRLSDYWMPDYKNLGGQFRLRDFQRDMKEYEQDVRWRRAFPKKGRVIP